MASKTLRDWLTKIASYSSVEIDLGLERVERVWQRLGAPAPADRIVTIAGTNGKGTCAHFLERCLRIRRYRVGLYTSPHLLRFNERMQIDGREIDDAALCRAFERVELARKDEPLTFFEYTSLAALCWFSQHELDVAILEVGLGGRLDAVNIVAGDVAIVTNVALDHQEHLGDTRERIAREKAGIFRAGRPAVCGDAQPPATLIQAARDRGAKMHFRGDAFYCEGAERHFSIRGDRYRFDRLPRPHGAPLAGFAAAIEALALLKALPETESLAGLLGDWSLPGRLQWLQASPTVVLDVAHNPQAGRALARALRARPVDGRTRLALGMLADKAVGEFIECLDSVTDEWLLVSLPGARGRSAQKLADRVRSLSVKPVRQFESVAGALALAQARSQDDDRIVVCGSFQMVGPALAWLGLYSGGRPGEGIRWSRS